MRIFLQLILIGIITISVASLKVHEHINEHDYVWVSEDKSQWIGYLPQCEFICKNKQEGQVCDTHPKVCCEKGKCSKKYDLTVCIEPVKHFRCNRNDHMHYENQQYFVKNVPELKPWFHPKDQYLRSQAQ